MSKPNNRYLTSAYKHVTTSNPPQPLVQCPHCQEEMSEDELLHVWHSLHNQLVWRGCYTCLHRANTTFQPQQSIDKATYKALMHAFSALTKPMSATEIGAVADEIESLLLQMPIP